MATSNDLADEALLEEGMLEPVSVVIERLTGRRPNPATIWRWVRRPGRGGAIPARLLFGCWHSTEAAVRAWLTRRSQYSLRAPPAPDGPSDEELHNRGLLS